MLVIHYGNGDTNYRTPSEEQNMPYKFMEEQALRFMRSGTFADRHDAGRQLASLLMKYKDEKPIVLALPRGGVPVGYEIALALDAPLDVFIARKLGAPHQPELGIGAI